jgi:hypothetical protein
LKTIFLDFDGVLHPVNASKKEYFSLASKLLLAIDGAECEIVISSSWRFHQPFSRLKSYLPKQLETLVVACTGEAFIGQHARYNEIQEYLRHDYVCDWCALDDSFFEYPKNFSRLILCDGVVGLDNLQIQKIKKWLHS